MLRHKKTKKIYLDKDSSWKNRFNEKIKDISRYSRFEEVINNPQLRTFFNTTFGELYNLEDSQGHNYRFFFGEDVNENDTVGEYLSRWYVSMKDSNDNLIDAQMKISVDNNDAILGFLILCIGELDNSVVSKKVSNESVGVTELCVFSLNFESINYTLTKDTQKIIEDIFIKNPTFSFVGWTAYINNPAIKMYYRRCKDWGGECIEKADFLEDDEVYFLINREGYFKPNKTYMENK